MRETTKKIFIRSNTQPSESSTISIIRIRVF